MVAPGLGDWFIILKENVVVAFLVLGDVGPLVICHLTFVGALPELSLVVLEDLDVI